LRSPTPSFDDSSAMANLQSMSVAEVHPFRARKGNFLRRQCSANLPRKQSPNLQISTSPSPSSGDNSAITKLQFKYVACCHPSCKPEGNISVGNVLRTCRENNLHIFTFPNFQIYTHLLRHPATLLLWLICNLCLSPAGHRPVQGDTADDGHPENPYRISTTKLYSLREYITGNVSISVAC